MVSKKGFAQAYDRIAWELRILIGGVLNIVFVKAIFEYVEANVFLVGGTYSIYNLLNPLLAQFAFLLGFGLVSPLLLSLILTKRVPELRVVPPFYIALFGFTWILIFGLSPLDPNYISSVFFGTLLLASGRAEDRVVTSLLGRTTERENIYFEELRVNGNIEDVKTRLSVPEIRGSLNLSDRVEGNAEKGYTLRTRGGFDFINKILLVTDKQFAAGDWTLVKVAYYEKARYNLRVSPSFLEDARKTSSYLKDVFLNRNPSLKYEIIVQFTNSTRDQVIDSIVDEMQGFYTRSKRMSVVDWFKILAIIGVLIGSIGLFFLGLTIYGGLAAVIDALFALSELPDILRRES